MKPEKAFLDQPPELWAFVRLVSERIGYVDATESDASNRITIDRIREAITSVSASLLLKKLPDIGAFDDVSYASDGSFIVHRGPVSPETADSLRNLLRERRGWTRAIDTLERRSQRQAWVSTRSLFRGAEPTDLANTLCSYLNYREAAVKSMRQLFMDKKSAKREFETLARELKSKRSPTMNKQSGAKRVPAYLTAMVHMLLDHYAGERGFDPDPQQLIKVVKNDVLLGVLSRRLDGAFPSPVRPVAIWEIKEYYHTTTFGSRIADGVYETLLDGAELQQIRVAHSVKIHHYLFIDGLETWWSSGGRPYLCRLVDAMHMGMIDEVVIGRDVHNRLPALIREWQRDLGTP